MNLRQFRVISVISLIFLFYPIPNYFCFVLRFVYIRYFVCPRFQSEYASQDNLLIIIPFRIHCFVIFNFVIGMFFFPFAFASRHSGISSSASICSSVNLSSDFSSSISSRLYLFFFEFYVFFVIYINAFFIFGKFLQDSSTFSFSISNSTTSLAISSPSDQSSAFSSTSSWTCSFSSPPSLLSILCSGPLSCSSSL